LQRVGFKPVPRGRSTLDEPAWFLLDSGMDAPPEKPPTADEAQAARRDREAKALRENLRKRKQQQRARETESPANNE
jgi:hypothetical protein